MGAADRQPSLHDSNDADGHAITVAAGKQCFLKAMLFRQAASGVQLQSLFSLAFARTLRFNHKSGSVRIRGPLHDAARQRGS